MARKSGRVASLKIQTDGAGGVAGWTAVGGKRDMTITIETSEQDVSGSESFDVFVTGGHNLTVEGQIVKDPADTQWEALREAHETRATLGFWALDAASGGKGYQFDGIVTRFNDTGNRADGQMTSVTIKPTPGTQPDWETDS